MKIRRALISVSDKTNLKEFVKGLDSLGIKILSTGGTAKFISDIGVEVEDVSSFTGFPEIMNGRVKTLHPKIHGALLGIRDNEKHVKEAKAHGIEFIDMVVVNLYPFSQTIARKDATFEEAIENIDIGGPSMMRSAAKNFRDVAVVSDPSMYVPILKELKQNGSSLSEATLLDLAVDVFQKTAAYDASISGYLKSRQSKDVAKSSFPSRLSICFNKIKDLRYGENPHQKAAFYGDGQDSASPSIISARQLHGKELSFNNIIDLNAACEIVSEFEKPCACVIKHATPCGVAQAGDARQAFIDALDCDRLSAFGGIVGLNRSVDGRLANEIRDAGFLECMIAPSYTEEALEVLTKKKNFRILEAEFGKPGRENAAAFDIKKIRGGVLLQEFDTQDADKKDLKVVTKKSPDAGELESLYFAWKVVKHVKSNAIVICNGSKTVGIGAGQMSRVDSVIIAIGKASSRARGAVLASDAFFPKPDSVEALAKAGVSAVIQPGGSVADKEVIEVANALGISMVFTGIRHFKH
ncbi:MAG: bifunctional phosphoribosylaminoimidazolecarboxamide formyltransferase/IMP cyclohydrolase [Candidatus Omnitrophica bacterium]|nr:bifunctional phosphoribosylaminoimidazolecarboxamide formyltransferase/IMP cyclohydrolase [Candidatus Omnitrophota bacterium]